MRYCSLLICGELRRGLIRKGKGFVFVLLLLKGRRDRVEGRRGIEIERQREKVTERKSEEGAASIALTLTVLVIHSILLSMCIIKLGLVILIPAYKSNLLLYLLSLLPFFLSNL